MNLISWVIDGCYINKTENTALACNEEEIEHQESHPPTEFQSFDGFYNNIFKIDLGAVGKS